MVIGMLGCGSEKFGCGGCFCHVWRSVLADHYLYILASTDSLYICRYNTLSTLSPSFSLPLFFSLSISLSVCLSVGSSVDNYRWSWMCTQSKIDSRQIKHVKPELYFVVCQIICRFDNIKTLVIYYFFF